MEQSDELPWLARFFRDLSRRPIFDYWLPAEYFDADDTDRVRAAALILFVYLTALLGIPFTYFYSVVHFDPTILVAIGLGVAPAVLVPVLLKWDGRLLLVAHIVCLCVYGATFLAAFGGNAPFRTGLPWLIVAPLYAALFADRRSVAFWSVLALATIVGFHFVGTPEPLPEDKELFRLQQEQTLSTALLAILVSCLVVFQETINDLLVAQLERARGALQKQATYDDLTGLPNRVLFRDRLQQSIRRARRRGHDVVVGFFDLDDFKRINDLYGHRAGDRLLADVAGRIDSKIRDEDTVARLGGDEFVGIFEGAHTEEDIDAIARRIRETLEREFELRDTTVEIGVSMGFAHFRPDDLRDVAEEKVGEILRKAADRAMYDAKADTGTDWRLSPTDPALARDKRIDRAREIEAGIEDNQFVPYYQPILSLADGTVVAAEILARWDHPDEGLLSPGEFLELATEVSLLDGIQESIVRNIRSHFSSARATFSSNPPVVDLFLNLDPEQLREARQMDDLHAILQDDELDRVRFTFEITETDLLGDQSIGTRLRSYGYRLAVDDFGTGYSSLNRLTEVPIDCLKIDMTFVQNIDSETYRSVVRNIGDLGARLGVPVIGEGVETAEQLEFLKSVRGCSYGQGYFLAEPEPFEAFATRIDEDLETADTVFDGGGRRCRRM